MERMSQKSHRQDESAIQSYDLLRRRQANLLQAQYIDLRGLPQKSKLIKLPTLGW